MSVSPLLAESLSLLSAGNQSDALLRAEKALGGGEDTVTAACVVAAVAFRSGQIAHALRVLEPMAELPGCSADVVEATAVLNCLAGRLHEALFCAKMVTTMPADGTLLQLFGPAFPKFETAFTQIVNRPLMRAAEDALRLGRLDEAVDRVEQHLSLFADDVEALDVYSDVLMRLGRTHEAIGVLRSVLTVGGHSATLLSRLGVCLAAIGDHQAALACHDLALTRAPKSALVWSNFLTCLDQSVDGRSHLREQAVARWRDFLNARLPKTVKAAPPATVKERLVVGFLCAAPLDVTSQIMVSRAAIARSGHGISSIGFGAGELSDEANLHYRSTFDRWRDISALDEMTLAALIRGEGVDVLIDVDGALTHTHPSLFLRNPAPVRVSWLNSPCALAMPGATHSLTGGVLASGPLLLDARNAVAAPAPVDRQGVVTFGADVTPGELTPRLAMAFASILAAVPESVLLLRDGGGLAAPENVDRLITLFGNFGVAHRIEVIQGSSQEFAADTDIALAPFPTLRLGSYGYALASGVPVVTLAEGRASMLAETLAALGVADGLVADDVPGYVAAAVALANDRQRLSAFRTQTMPALRGHAAFEPAAFAQGLEAALRGFLAESAKN
ncbi:MAG TPA: hypothetical protein VK196_01890 [Magnetospirillum sp.]|nr:hypothetical protein [Magnetospirillum sp.]